MDNRDLDHVESRARVEAGVSLFHSTASYDNAQQQAPEWQASAGSSSFFQAQHRARPMVNPRWEWASRWTQAVLLARGVTLATDPLFFYALSLTVGRRGAPCVRVGHLMAWVATSVRTCLDALHAWHLWVQLRTACVSRGSVMRRGKLERDARTIALRYIRSFSGFWLDVFVILPIPQAAFWLLVPQLVKTEKVKLALTTLILTFLFQFIPKIYHSFCLITTMQQATGYIFGTIWWDFGLSLVLYLVSSHVIGGYWYVLATGRIFSCLEQQCENKGVCNLSSLCAQDVCYQFINDQDVIANPCGTNFTAISKPLCLDADGPFGFGIYAKGVLVVSSNSLAVKIMYPIFWGLFNLSTFGNNLSPTPDVVEILFSMFIVTCGLILFTVIVANIQVFLSIILAKNKKMHLRRRDLEWWMKRRQLPGSLRRRVRQFELQTWDVLGGQDQMDWIEELPEGLRRDIKRYLCLDLISEVPLFHNLDDLVVGNICDRLKPLVVPKNEKIIREGDPVPRMIFIVQGRVKRYQNLVKGKVATSVLRRRGFIGDELIYWCLRRPFRDRLPTSSATFICTKSMEAFSIEANNLKYIADHLRHKFACERLRRTMRYSSSNWRMWAAVIIQFAWRRYKARNASPAVVHGGHLQAQLGRYG